MLAFITQLFPTGFGIYMEVFLTGALIALIAAAGYTFFVYSMKDDYADKSSELYCDNPWDCVGKQDGKDHLQNLQKSRRKKATIIGIALLAAAAIVLILLILLITDVYSVFEIV